MWQLTNSTITELRKIWNRNPENKIRGVTAPITTYKNKIDTWKDSNPGMLPDSTFAVHTN